MLDNLASHLQLLTDDHDTNQEFHALIGYTASKLDRQELAIEFATLENQLLQSIAHTLHKKSLANLKHIISTHPSHPQIHALVDRINQDYGVGLNMYHPDDIIRAVKYRLQAIYPEYDIQTGNSSFDPGFIKAFGNWQATSLCYQETCLSYDHTNCGPVDCVIGTSTITALLTEYQQMKSGNIAIDMTQAPADLTSYYSQAQIESAMYDQVRFQKEDGQAYGNGDTFVVKNPLNIQKSDGSGAIILEPGNYKIQIDPNNEAHKQLIGKDATIYNITCQDKIVNATTIKKIIAIEQVKN